MNFSNRVIWITGASSGIGAALARELSRRGARLILSARRGRLLAELREDCFLPDAHLVLPLDITDSGQVAEAAIEAEAHFGHIDMVILAAGITQRALALETLTEVERKIMDVNYFGPVSLAKAVLPGMLARGKGRVVVISSLAGRISTPYRSTYAASKHALHGYFNALRAEVADAGVDVQIVSPGYVRTDITLNALRGDGTHYGHIDEMQQNGMPPEICARAIVRAIARGREEAIIGGREKWAVFLYRFFPHVYHRMVRNLSIVRDDEPETQNSASNALLTSDGAPPFSPQ